MSEPSPPYQSVVAVSSYRRSLWQYWMLQSRKSLFGLFAAGIAGVAVSPLVMPFIAGSRSDAPHPPVNEGGMSNAAPLAGPFVSGSITGQHGLPLADALPLDSDQFLGISAVPPLLLAQSAPMVERPSRPAVVPARMASGLATGPATGDPAPVARAQAAHNTLGGGTAIIVHGDMPQTGIRGTVKHRRDASRVTGRGVVANAGNIVVDGSAPLSELVMSKTLAMDHSAAPGVAANPSTGSGSVQIASVPARDLPGLTLTEGPITGSLDSKISGVGLTSTGRAGMTRGAYQSSLPVASIDWPVEPNGAVKTSATIVPASPSATLMAVLAPPAEVLQDRSGPAPRQVSEAAIGGQAFDDVTSADDVDIPTLTDIAVPGDPVALWGAASGAAATAKADIAPALPVDAPVKLASEPASGSASEQRRNETRDLLVTPDTAATDALGTEAPVLVDTVSASRFLPEGAGLAGIEAASTAVPALQPSPDTRAATRAAMEEPAADDAVIVVAHGVHHGAGRAGAASLVAEDQDGRIIVSTRSASPMPQANAAVAGIGTLGSGADAWSLARLPELPAWVSFQAPVRDMDRVGAR